MNPRGLGVDIIEIERVKDACSKNPRLLNRLFTSRELEDYASRGSRAETLAGKFAAKEAVLKALGTGLRGLGWHDLEVLPDSLGKPRCVFSEHGRTWLKTLGVSEVLISIAHNRTTAMANAIALEQEVRHEAGNE